MASAVPKVGKREKSLLANYKKAVNEFHPYLDFVINESNVGQWWCRFRDIEGRDDEFHGGEYIIEMNAPADYPFSPPVFYVRTPNGVYDGGYNKNINVCIGIGHFHKADYAAGQGGMMGFIMMTLNGFMNWRLTGTGIGILHSEYFTRGAHAQQEMDEPLNVEKRRLANESRAYNRKHFPKIMDLFDDLPFSKARSAIATLELPDWLARSVTRAITGN